MLKKTAILVISCDKYSDLWPIYFESLFKYWPNCPFKIYLGSNFKTYDHKDVTMINIGKDLDYSSNMIAMINEIKEDYIITTVEDMFLSEPMNEEHLFLYFQEFYDNNAAHLKLIYTYPIGYDRDVSKRIAVVSSNVRYRLGLGPSLWNKEILKENLVSGMSAWAMEKEGKFGRDIPAGDIYSINYHFSGEVPFKYIHSVAKGAWIRNAIPWLIKEGYQEILPNREKLSWSGTVYSWLFARLMTVFIKTRYKWRP